MQDTGLSNLSDVVPVEDLALDTPWNYVQCDEVHELQLLLSLCQGLQTALAGALV